MGVAVRFTARPYPGFRSPEKNRAQPPGLRRRDGYILQQIIEPDDELGAAPVEPNERQLQREQKLHTEHAPRGRRLGSRAKDVGRSGSLRRGDWVRARTDARLAAKAEGSAHVIYSSHGP